MNDVVGRCSGGFQQIGSEVVYKLINEFHSVTNK